MWDFFDNELAAKDKELVAALDVIKKLVEANAAWAAEFDKVWEATGDPYQKHFMSLERMVRELRQENERLRKNNER